MSGSTSHPEAYTSTGSASGVTLAAPLSAAHPVGARVVNTSSLGTGVTLVAPLASSHPAGATVSGPTTGLISDSPQGQIIGVLNNGLVLLEVSPFWQQVVKGAVILAAVAVDRMGEQRD